MHDPDLAAVGLPQEPSEPGEEVIDAEEVQDADEVLVPLGEPEPGADEDEIESSGAQDIDGGEPDEG